MTPERVILVCFIGVLICLAAINARQLILPDSITLPVIAIGLILSWFFPALHGKSSALSSVLSAVLGLLCGAILVYTLSFVGKMAFGTVNLPLAAGTKVTLNQTSLVLPDEEIDYGDIFYRNSDQLTLSASAARLTLVNGSTPKAFTNVAITLSPTRLLVGDASYPPDEVISVTAVTDRVTLPREVIGFGVIKLAALIGVFLGWEGALFTILCGGVGATLSVLLVFALRLTQNSQFEPVTAICVASLIWIVLRPHLTLAAISAIALAATASFVVNRIVERLR